MPALPTRITAALLAAAMLWIPTLDSHAVAAAPVVLYTLA